MHVFAVDVRLEAATNLAPESCWYPLVGPANIICGFPVPDRQNGERGLEISVSAMAAMAGIPQAVSFKGGFIFKGRSHALVPIERLGESVQWHMLDVYPAKLGWGQVDELCPTRLEGHMDDIAGRRTFVGWFSDVLELLGTHVTRQCAGTSEQGRLLMKCSHRDRRVRIRSRG